MSSTKSHAKDYLLDYKAKNISNWLKILIERVLELGDQLNEREKDSIFSSLLEENNLNSSHQKSGNALIDPASPKEVDRKKKQTLILQKLTHHSGVNALIPQQSLIFSRNCTIIYGLSGTGKSGYFRIIHELAGGERYKKILGNIYSKTSSLDVDIEFFLGTITKKTFKWTDRARRGIYPFNQIKVFDSEYLPFFLDERESSVNVEPLGLNLFQIIASSIAEFKSKLSTQKQAEEIKKPDLTPLIESIHSSDLKIILSKSNLNDKEKEILKGNQIFSTINAKKLEKLKTQKQKFERNNTEDRERILVQEVTEVNALKSHLGDLKIKIEAISTEINSGIKDYSDKKEIRDKRRKEFEVLKNIPSRETEEWQNFIESAKEYEKEINKQNFDTHKVCLYCHQSLKNEALSLVHSYGEYLTDQSQKNFKNTEIKLQHLREKAKNIDTKFPFTEARKEIFGSVHNKPSSLESLVNQLLSDAEQQKANLGKGFTAIEKYVLDIKTIELSLAELATEKQKELKELQQSTVTKERKVKGLDSDINKLEDKQNLKKWRGKVSVYYQSTDKISKLESTNDNISTRGITDLGAKAHDELLTDNIRKSFEEELKFLCKNLEVSLEKTSADKGTVRRRLKILGNDVIDILSEGEQKAVGLALFLAEINSQSDTSPVIFDDPVTSLDHEVADSLAQRLIRMSLDRQVVIFTHNKLFYGSLDYWSNNLKNDQNQRSHHICKNYSACDKQNSHVHTYKADREAKGRTGKLLEMRIESLNYYIRKIEDQIKGSYTLSTVSGDLKSAIEHYIDEKIIQNIDLMKHRPQKVTISWERLRKINEPKERVDKLKEYWDKLSNRGDHVTANSSENPLKLEDLREIINFLKQK